ncbi:MULTISPECIES: hypothetical protein [Burkholderia]|uniref:Uncharacterized protein n=1 Tax=Burkholderia orbicola TaxID=2978683 RepID=A0ABT8P1L9_9BURK|nr:MULTISPECIES: hypothetical protein [Burkholderia]MDN7527710.1 hypothetical protein [Burkholderia orbicola]
MNVPSGGRAMRNIGVWLLWLLLAAAVVVVATQTGISRYFVVATGKAVCVDTNPDGGISNDTCR